MVDLYAPQPFDIDKLYPAHLPRIHPVPATYRQGVAQLAGHFLEAVMELHRLCTIEPDNDAAIDAAMLFAKDPYAALFRALELYRPARGVEGWS